jgi:uncharacterized membrane protein
MMFHEAMFAAFVVLQVADAISTIYGTNLGYGEKNPLLAWLFDKVGVTYALLCVKGLAILLTHHYLEDIPTFILVIANLVYTYVVFNNLKIISEDTND